MILLEKLKKDQPLSFTPSKDTQKMWNCKVKRWREKSNVCNFKQSVIRI